MRTYGNCFRSCHESAESVRGRIRFVKICSGATVNNRRNFPMPIELSGFELPPTSRGTTNVRSWKYRRFELLAILENGEYSFSVNKEIKDKRNSLSRKIHWIICENSIKRIRYPFLKKLLQEYISSFQQSNRDVFKFCISMLPVPSRTK